MLIMLTIKNLKNLSNKPLMVNNRCQKGCNKNCIMPIDGYTAVQLIPPLEP